MIVLSWEPTVVYYKDKEFCFINRELAEDFITDLEDALSGAKRKSITLMEDDDYIIYELEMYSRSSEAITELLGI